MAEFIQRRFTRNDIELPLQYHIPHSGDHDVTRAYNVSQGGVYFKTFRPLSSDTDIEIIMPNPPPGAQSSGAYVGYLARIRWCRELEEKKGLRFGVGVQFIRKTRELADVPTLDKRLLCDLCGSLVTPEIICRVDGAVCLCPHCHKHLARIPDGFVRDCILRFLEGNVV